MKTDIWGLVQHVLIVSLCPASLYTVYSSDTLRCQARENACRTFDWLTTRRHCQFLSLMFFISISVPQLQLQGCRHITDETMSNFLHHSLSYSYGSPLVTQRLSLHQQAPCIEAPVKMTLSKLSKGAVNDGEVHSSSSNMQ